MSIETTRIVALPQGPLDEFVGLLVLLGRHRGLMGDRLPQTTLDDLCMMTTERLVVGLRDPWVRRTALPIWNAQRALRSDEGSIEHRLLRAREILQQLAPDANPLNRPIHARMVGWIDEFLSAIKRIEETPRPHPDVPSLFTVR